MAYVPPLPPPPPPAVSSECREKPFSVTYTNDGTLILHEPTGVVISVLGPSQKRAKPERRPTHTRAAQELEKRAEEPRAPEPEPPKEPRLLQPAPTPVRQRKAAGSWTGAPLGVPSL